MDNFTAADAVNVVNDSVELIKLRSVEYWLDHIYTMMSRNNISIDQLFLGP